MTTLNPASSPLSETLHFRRLGIWMLFATLALGTLSLYLPSVHHDFIDYDDNVYVYSNAYVQNGLTLQNLKWAFSQTVCGNWHPLTMLGHMLDCQLYGLNPAGHHLTNLLWHTLNATLLFWFLHQLTGSTGRSFAVAALFACHQLHVQSVAWVAERKDVLSTCFGFLTLCLYVKYVQSLRISERNPVGAGRRRFSNSTYLWLAWLTLALGLMCKPMLVTWPFLMLLLDYWPLNRLRNAAFMPLQRSLAKTANRDDKLQTETERGIHAVSTSSGKLAPKQAEAPLPPLGTDIAVSWKSLITEKIPGFLLVSIFSVIAFVVQSDSGATYAMTKGLPLSIRCGNAVLSYGWYVLKTLWPTNLAVFYPYRSQLPVNHVILAAMFLGVISFYVWYKRRPFPVLFIGWLWFIGTLVPVIGVVQIGGQAMADRYAYIPLVGLFISFVWGLYELSRTWRHQAIVLSATGLTIVAFFSVVTRQQLAYWQNSETLFLHDLQVTDDNLVARANLAVYYRSQNRIDDAIKQFQAGAQLRPDYVEGRNDLANLLARQGRIDDAIHELQDVIHLKPEFPEAHCSLGRILADHGRGDEALAQFQEALRLKPNYGEAHYALGHLLNARGEPDAALAQLLEAEHDQFGDPAVYFEAGKLLSEKNQIDAAIAQFQTAVRINPNLADVRNELGKLLADKGRLDEAGFQFQEAIRTAPDNAEARNNLGNVLAIKGQSDAAAVQFQEAIRLKPNYADSYFNLGNLLANGGRTAEAIAQFQQAVRLNPNDAEAHYILGNLFSKQNKTDEAIHELQEALRIRPNYTAAAAQLSRITQLKGMQPNN